jgi:hypothetical protein
MWLNDLTVHGPEQASYSLKTNGDSLTLWLLRATLTSHPHVPLTTDMEYHLTARNRCYGGLIV